MKNKKDTVKDKMEKTLDKFKGRDRGKTMPKKWNARFDKTMGKGAY